MLRKGYVTPALQWPCQNLLCANCLVASRVSVTPTISPPDSDPVFDYLNHGDLRELSCALL